MDEPGVVELKSISQRLRAAGSRAMRAKHETAGDDIRRLLLVVDETPILKAVVEAHPKPEMELAGHIKEVAQQGGRIRTPLAEAEEVCFLHHVLTAIAADAEAADDAVWRLTYGYANKRGVNDGLEQLLHDAVGPYVEVLSRLVAGCLLAREEAAGPGAAFQVTISGDNSQVNIAQSGGRVFARQEIRADVERIEAAVRDLEAAISGADDLSLDEGVGASLSEIGSAVSEEVGREAPRKELLQLYRERLVVLSGTLIAADTVAEKAVALIQTIGHLLGIGDAG